MSNSSSSSIRTYDLVTEAADYPAWPGKPRRTLLICTHPRSGSTLLGEMLHSIGGFGCPLEYMHRGFRPAFMERWQTPTLSSLLEAVYRHRTDHNGVLSAKLFWLDIEDLLAEMNPSLLEQINIRPADNVPPTAYRKLYALLCNWFPEPAFIHLIRRDRVRQAVSAVVATQTRQWRSIPGAEMAATDAPVEYDYHRILGLVGLADYCNGHWQRFFAANALKPHVLAYEDLIAPGRSALQKLCADLGCNKPLQEPRMRRQADTRSERWLAQFLADHQAASARS